MTSLIHWKADTASITQADLDRIFVEAVPELSGKSWPDASGSVIDLIFAQADEAVRADEGVNFANKIVLSIAIRLQAESYMVAKLADSGFTDSITSNQTWKLFSEFTQRGLGDSDAVEVLRTVMLMTPENIHINSFMYEPIIDMSDNALRELYVKASELADIAKKV